MGYLKVVLCALTFASCARTDLPVTVWIDANADPQQLTDITDAIDEANEVFGGLLGMDRLIIVAGTKERKHPFVLDDVVGPDKVIWIIDEPFEGFDAVAFDYGVDRPTVGYGVPGGVLVFTFVDPVFTGEELLRRLMLHELGHFLGLGHSDNPEDVMYPGSYVPHYSEGDRAQFCWMYECR